MIIFFWSIEWLAYLGALLTGLAVLGPIMHLTEEHVVLLKVPVRQGYLAHRAPAK